MICKFTGVVFMLNTQGMVETVLEVAPLQSAVLAGGKNNHSNDNKTYINA